MAQREADPLVKPFFVAVAVLAEVGLLYLFPLNAGGFLAPALYLGTAAILILLFLLLSPFGLTLAAAIDTVNMRIGRVVAWAILLAVIVSTLNAIVRKVFNTSANSWLEMQWLLFGLVFLFCSPWTLMDNEHIRIDIVNGMLPRRGRSWIDLIGHAFFLMPLCFVMIYLGLPFARRSAPSIQKFFGMFADSPLNWPRNFLDSGELSLSAGGLPQWPAKLLIPVAFMLLMVQGVSELIKRVAIMQGRMDDPHAVTHSAAELEAERILQMAAAEGAVLPPSAAPERKR